MNLLTRDVPPRSAWALEQAGIHPLLARLYAARGVQSKDELDDALNLLLPPAGMLGTTEAAKLLADAMAQNKRLCIVADYDCDGATACAVAVRGLRMLGAQNVSYLVPDRVVDGYGLTPPIARRVKDSGADVLVTVDNGIASVEGVAEATALIVKIGSGAVSEVQLAGLPGLTCDLVSVRDAAVSLVSVAVDRLDSSGVLVVQGFGSTTAFLTQRTGMAAGKAGSVVSTARKQRSYAATRVAQAHKNDRPDYLVGIIHGQA